MFRRLYDWVLGWSETHYGTWVLALVAFAESSFFPIPPDPMLIALCLGKPKRSFYYALVCTALSIAGGAFGYLIGYVVWDTVSGFFFSYLINPETFERVSRLYEQNEFVAILGAALTPIPYKVFTISAGVFKLNFFVFIVASILGRAGRFFLLAGLIFFDWADKFEVFTMKKSKLIDTAMMNRLILRMEFP